MDLEQAEALRGNYHSFNPKDVISIYYIEGHLDFLQGHPRWKDFEGWEINIAAAYKMGYDDAAGDVRARVFNDQH